MRLGTIWNNIKTEKSEPFYLRNCSLVIDGQNYFYGMYIQSKLPYIFGAEANEYAKFLKEKLKMFKNANIECYIVFKGGDKDKKKNLDKLSLATFDFESDKFVAPPPPPVLMKDIYRQVLDELGVKYATSVLEAKDDCIALAQTLNCPVLSHVKEFFYKNVLYVPYPTIKYKGKEKYIECKKYHLKDFFQQYSLNDKKQAIILAVLNETAFSNVNFNKFVRKLNINDEDMFKQIKYILKWLSEHSVTEALNTITSVFSSKSEKDEFLKLVDELERKPGNNEGVIQEYLLKSCNINYLPSFRREPQWFEKGVATQKIAIPYINLYKHKYIPGSWAIEKNVNCTDSIMLSIDIIKYAYNLLTNFQPTLFNVYQTSKDYITVSTTSNIKKPTYSSTESVFEYGWDDIKKLELFENFLIANNINIDIINNFPANARMLFISLSYFARKKALEHVQVTKEVYSIITSYVMLNIVFDSTEYNTKNIRDETLGKTNRYFKYCQTRAKQIFDENTLKILVEFQYCLLHMNYLNILCGSPFQTTIYHETFNGTFIYQMIKDMDGSNNREFINKLLNSSAILGYINSFIDMYEKLDT